jgi:hypothetical protein
MTTPYEYISQDLETMTVEHVNRHNNDGTVSWIPIEPKNADYQEYLRWAEENNV